MHSRFANEDALREIYRVLTPGGVLGMIWNVEDCLLYQSLTNARVLIMFRQCPQILDTHH